MGHSHHRRYAGSLCAHRAGKERGGCGNGHGKSCSIGSAGSGGSCPPAVPPSPAPRSAFESPRRRDGCIRPAPRSRLKALDMAGRGGGRGAAQVASRLKELRPGQTSPTCPSRKGAPTAFHYLPRNVSPEVREIVRMCEIRHRRAALLHDHFKYLTR